MNELRSFGRTPTEWALNADEREMNVYAWKLSMADEIAIEGMTTLDELERRLDEFALPGAPSSKQIISTMQVMEHEGQGVYRQRAGDKPWTMLWVALKLSSPATHLPRR